MCFTCKQLLLFLYLTRFCNKIKNFTITDFSFILFIHLNTRYNKMNLFGLSFILYILAANTYFMNRIESTKHIIMVLKPANKYQITQYYHYFKRILINYFHHTPLFIAQKFYKHCFLQS